MTEKKNIKNMGGKAISDREAKYGKLSICLLLGTMTFLDLTLVLRPIITTVFLVDKSKALYGRTKL